MMGYTKNAHKLKRLLHMKEFDGEWKKRLLQWLKSSLASHNLIEN